VLDWEDSGTSSFLVDYDSLRWVGDFWEGIGDFFLENLFNGCMKPTFCLLGIAVLVVLSLCDAVGDF
jgi:hypothetical protein